MPKEKLSSSMGAKDPIQYNFALDGGRSNQLFCLVNNTDDALQLASIRITTNALIESPWQTLGEKWENVVISEDGHFFTYTLNLQQPLIIPPGNFNALEYTIQNAGNLGPLSSVAMPPCCVEIKLTEQNTFKKISLINPTPQPDPHPNKKLKMYHAQWGQYSYKKNMQNETWQDINSLNYAFTGFDVNGNVFTLDGWADELELPLLSLQQQRLPYLQTALSFGGWTNNGERMDTVFSALTANPQALDIFVKNVKNAVIQTGVTGVGIDWEYVAPQDIENYISLLQKLRDALPTGTAINIAAPAGIDNINAFTAQQWQKIATLVDDICPMCYDYFGGFSQYSDFHAPWQLSPNSPYVKSGFDIKTTVTTYQQKGVPANKIYLGMPNYARSMIVNAAGDYAGLYQLVVGTPQGDFPGANGIYSWNSIYNFLNNKPSPLDQLNVAKWQYYDATHPLCQDAKMCLLTGQLPTGQWVVINFLDQTSAQTRAEQTMQLGFGGAMVWANYFETTDENNSLVHAISNGLNPTQQPKLEKVIKKPIEKISEKEKQNIVIKLLGTEDINEREKTFAENKEKLAQHRNPIKRWLTNILPKSVATFLFEPPKHFTFAETAIKLRREQPTRIIERAIPFSAYDCSPSAPPCEIDFEDRSASAPPLELNSDNTEPSAPPLENTNNAARFSIKNNTAGFFTQTVKPIGSTRFEKMITDITSYVANKIEKALTLR